MKISNYLELGGRIIVTVIHDDGMQTTLNMVNTGDRDGILKDAYIISNDKNNRAPYIGEIPDELEEWTPPAAIPAKINILNTEKLQVQVLDQYGIEMDEEPTWSIEGTEKVKIEDGIIIGGEVETDTSFFIVAKVGEIETRVESILFATKTDVLNDTEAQILNLQREIERGQNYRKAGDPSH